MAADDSVHPVWRSLGRHSMIWFSSPRLTRSRYCACSDIASSGVAGTLVLEPWRRVPAFGHTASRRLALASARTGVTKLVVRSRADAERGANPLADWGRAVAAAAGQCAGISVVRR